jgi:AraC-like DNA-binding protein
MMEEQAPQSIERENAGQSRARPAFWADTDLPLSRWIRFASTDIEAVHHHMTEAFCPHQLATEGGLPPISFRHNQIVLKSLTFNTSDYGTPFGRVAVTVPSADDIMLVQFVLSGRAAFSHQGRTFELHPGHFCVMSGRIPVHQIFHSGCRHFTIKGSRTQLEKILALDLGVRTKPLVFSPDPVPLKAAAATFSRLVRTICDDIDEGMSGYLHPRIVGPTEDTLARMLLAAVPHNYSDNYATAARDAAAPGAIPYYVRRVEEFIHAHSHEAMSLSDLIEVSGVSGRSLHAGFRRFRGESPMGFLRNCRLDRARRFLKCGIEGRLNVTDIAIAAGFTHPSRFAQDYTRRFGELPSSTLKRLNSR